MTEWTKRTQPIQVGDTVGYSKRFLERTGELTGELSSARGEVKALLPQGNNKTLAVVDWQTPGLPRRVNVKILSTIKEIRLGE